MRLKPLLFGLATFVPGAYTTLSRPTGGTDSARYCYSVWLRHLIMARQHGLDYQPETVCELGPGDSLGVGLAALISGASRYYAVDAVQRASASTCVPVFDELVQLFRGHAVVPDSDEFPRVRPRLPSYRFPGELLSDDHLSRALHPDRLHRLRREVEQLRPSGEAIAYVTPAHAHLIPPDTVDLVLSQGVLEYPDDLPAAYHAMAAWLRPGGVASHAIDFGAHQTSNAWDGHWAISDFAWACLRGRQPYFLNRVSHSCHLDHFRAAGLTLICDAVQSQMPETSRHELRPRFRSLPDADLRTRAAFIQGRKPCICSPAARVR